VDENCPRLMAINLPANILVIAGRRGGIPCCKRSCKKKSNHIKASHFCIFVCVYAYVYHTTCVN
jgi:hypothetical protein